MKIKPHLCVDFYKPSHIDQYNKSTTLIQSNFTPRTVKLFPHFSDNDHRILFAGLQGVIKWYFIDSWNEEFFSQPKAKVVAEYKKIMDVSIGKDKVDVSGIEKLHDLGYLPLEIRALPEGSLVNAQVPVFTIHNTVPEFYWLVNFIESVISAESWKTITAATSSYQMNKLCHKYSNLTCDNNEHIMFQSHEFAFRGQAGVHDASQTGFGHLINFYGTDTVPAIVYANNYYGMEDDFTAASIPASEHSVATTNIGSIILEMERTVEGFKDLSLDEKRYKAEVQFLRKYITEIYPSGFCSYVLDSFDFWRGLTEAALELKEEIMTRDGRVIFRPDSGIPEHIIAGYTSDGVNYSDFSEAMEAEPEAYEVVCINGKYHPVYQNQYGYTDINEAVEIPEHEVKGSIEILFEQFGGHVNSKGYKVLDPHVGLIYGDSITISRANDIFERLKDRGFASSNVVFGWGSYMTTYATRDSLGFAMKATGAIINGDEILVTKDPKTDSKKKSAKGFLKVVKVNEDFELVDGLRFEDTQSQDNALRVVFKDSKLLVDETLTEIRKRVADSFND